MQINFLIKNKLLIVSVLASILNLGMLVDSAEAKPTNRNRRLKINKVKVTKLTSLSKQENKLNVPFKQNSLIANSFAGKASWYGPKFHGRPTASGEVFNQHALTAAHPRLRFGTKVKVTNLNNGRSVVVRINDRGPFVSDRVIDVSAAAARSLGMISSGVAPVRITVLGL